MSTVEKSPAAPPVAAGDPSSRQAMVRDAYRRMMYDRQSMGEIPEEYRPVLPLVAARDRVDYRLTYGCTEQTRTVHGAGIDGPDLPNSYFHLRGADRPGNTNPAGTSATGSGDWHDPDHPDQSADEDDHIERWFGTAVREAVHEALEWFWADETHYLDPHGKHVEDLVHAASGEFVERLIEIRKIGIERTEKAAAESANVTRRTVVVP